MNGTRKTSDRSSDNAGFESAVSNPARTLTRSAWDLKRM
jgi:hypothetical protein